MASNQMLGGSAIGTIPTVLGTVGGGTSGGGGGGTGASGPSGPTGPTGPVAGSDTQVIYNKLGSAGATGVFTYNYTSGTLTTSALVVNNGVSVSGNVSFTSNFTYTPSTGQLLLGAVVPAYTIGSVVYAIGPSASGTLNSPTNLTSVNTVGGTWGSFSGTSFSLTSLTFSTDAYSSGSATYTNGGTINAIIQFSVGVAVGQTGNSSLTFTFGTSAGNYTVTYIGAGSGVTGLSIKNPASAVVYSFSSPFPIYVQVIRTTTALAFQFSTTSFASVATVYTTPAITPTDVFTVNSIVNMNYTGNSIANFKIYSLSIGNPYTTMEVDGPVVINDSAYSGTNALTVSGPTLLQTGLTVSGNITATTGTTTLGTTNMSGNLNMNLCNITNLGADGFSFNTLTGGIIVTNGAVTVSGSAYGGTYMWYKFTASAAITTIGTVPNVYYFAIGGGGGGGCQTGGGGGAGGLQTNDPNFISTISALEIGSGGSPLTLVNGSTYTINIGVGGASVTSSPGLNGTNTTFSLSGGSILVNASGGGGGGAQVNITYNSTVLGSNGGCGGGAGLANYSGSAPPGGTGSQGFSGGAGGIYGVNGNWGGGGGGIGGSGVSSTSTTQLGTGGVGLTYLSSNYGGGGGTGATGSFGGGSSGGSLPTAGTGGGGSGGTGGGNGSSGASGVFILLIPTPAYQAVSLASMAVNSGSNLQIGSSNSLILAPGAGCNVNVSGNFSSITGTTTLGTTNMTGNLNMNLCNITNLGADGFSFNTGTYAFSFSVTPSATITPGDGYTYYLLTASSTITTNYTVTNVKYLAVGGGGGGGQTLGGGGGAGGLRTNDPSLSSIVTASQYVSGYLTMSPGNYTLVIGSGGAGGVFSTLSAAGNGTSTTFTGISDAVGGAAGGSFASGAGASGNNGGCGGGGSWDTVVRAGGIGSQGYNGGSGSTTQYFAGGGGGLASVGISGTTIPGRGGYATSYLNVSYGGGGGGGCQIGTSASGGGGGAGVGGVAVYNQGTVTVAGDANANSGSGGGGGGQNRDGGKGGSGLFILGIPTTQVQGYSFTQLGSVAVNASYNLAISATSNIVLAPGAGLTISGGLSSGTVTNVLTYNASTGSVGYGTVSSGPPTSVNVFTVSATSLALTTASAGYYYYITNTGFNALTMPGTLPTTAGTFWTLRNATSSYLSVTVANNANLTTPLVLTPSNNTTIVVTVSGTSGATISGYILF